MKKNRIIWAILLIISLVGISWFGGPVSYGFFAVLILIPIMSLLYLLLVAIFFRIYQDLPGKQLTACQTYPFTFRLMNEFPFAFAGIRVGFFSSFSTISGLSDDEEYELLPKTGIREDTELVCKYRGEYEVGIKKVVLQDYFRLFKISLNNNETKRVLVRPALIDLEDLCDVDFSNMMRRDIEINPSEPDVLTREYEPGDDVRFINWKVSAGSGKLMVRKMIGEEKEGIAILTGTERFSEKQEEHLPLENKMMECTIALALYCHRKNIPVTEYYLADQIVKLATAGADQFDLFYDEFSNIRFQNTYKEAKLMEMAAASQELFNCKAVFIVIHEWSDKVTELLTLLGGNNVYAIVYLIGNENRQELPRAQFPRAVLIQFETDDDLKEVM